MSSTAKLAIAFGSGAILTAAFISLYASKRAANAADTQARLAFHAALNDATSDPGLSFLQGSVGAIEPALSPYVGRAAHDAVIQALGPFG